MYFIPPTNKIMDTLVRTSDASLQHVSPIEIILYAEIYPSMHHPFESAPMNPIPTQDSFVLPNLFPAHGDRLTLQPACFDRIVNIINQVIWRKPSHENESPSTTSLFHGLLQKIGMVPTKQERQ